MAAFTTAALTAATGVAKAVGGISTLTKVASLGVSANAALKQQEAADQAAKVGKEANEVRGAMEKIKNSAARQRSARAERIRRASLLSASTVTGSGGSSGLYGAQSAIGSNFGAARARQSEQIIGANALSSLSQKSANAQADYQRAQAQGKFYSGLVDFGNEVNWFQ